MQLPHSRGFARELEVAASLAREAGAVSLSHRSDDIFVDLKKGGEPVTIADREASDLIVAGLRSAFPDDVIISEEHPDDLRRLTAPRVWYIDPIDGTKDYIRGGDGFCVMIGLTVGHIPTVGVLFQPVGSGLFVAAPDCGSFFQSPAVAMTRLTCSAVDTLDSVRLVVSKSHRTPEIDQVKSALGISSELNVGSVGLKIGLIALGERDLYVNPSSHCKSWDTCAPEAVITHAGGALTDRHGAALPYDQKDVHRRHGLVGSNGAIHRAVIQRLADIFPKP